MKSTVQLTRTGKAKEAFDQHIAALQKKYPDVEDLLSEEAVDILRAEGVEIERVIDLGNPYYLMTSTHPYPGVDKHYVLYAGLTDYQFMNVDVAMSDPNHPRHQTFINNVKSALAVLAAIYAQRKAYRDYLIVIKSDGTLNHTPHVHLLVYKD